MKKNSQKIRLLMVPLVITPILLSSISLVNKNHINEISNKNLNNKNVISIVADNEYTSDLASIISTYKLKKIVEPYYENPNPYPGDNPRNFDIVNDSMIRSNALGKISQIKVFPKKYMENGVVVDNDTSNPTVYQMMEISGFQKVITTEFISSEIVINAKEIDTYFNNFLPSDIDDKTILNVFYDILSDPNNTLKNEILTPPSNNQINLYSSFALNNLEIDSSFPTENEDVDGVKKIKLKINGNFFDQNKELVLKDEGKFIVSGIIKIENFGQDLLGNGTAINEDTSTIFEINHGENIVLNESTSLPSQFLSLPENQNLKPLIDPYMKLGFSFNNGEYSIDETLSNDFDGSVDITVSIPKYIKNGEVINTPWIQEFKIVGFGQDLLNNGNVTDTNINTSFVSGNNIGIDGMDNTLPSEYQSEDLLNALQNGTKEILSNAPHNDNKNFQMAIQNRDDETGIIEVALFIDQYIKNGKLINGRLEQKTTITGFKTFVVDGKLTNIILISTLSSIAGLILVAGGIYFLLKKQYSHKEEQYQNLLLENNISLPKIENKKARKMITHKKIATISLPLKSKENYNEQNNNYEDLEAKQHVDNIKKNITSETNYEDTIDRLMNEMEDDF